VLEWQIWSKMTCTSLKLLFWFALVNLHLFCSRARGIVCDVYLLFRLVNHEDPCKRCVVALWSLSVISDVAPKIIDMVGKSFLFSWRNGLAFTQWKDQQNWENLGSRSRRNMDKEGALTSHQCGSGWFSPCFEGFSARSPVFLPPLKATSPNFNSTRMEDLHESQLRLMWLLS